MRGVLMSMVLFSLLAPGCASAFTADGFVRVQGSHFALSSDLGRTFKVKGFNYYPQRHPWAIFSEWDPAEVIVGVADEQILGVEAPLWTETVRTLADIDALAFPRAAAAAEAAWSPAVGASELRTWDSFATRVGALAPLWTSQGIGFTPLEGIPWAVEVVLPAFSMASCTSLGRPSKNFLFTAALPKYMAPISMRVRCLATSYTRAGPMPLAKESAPSVTPVWMLV